MKKWVNFLWLLLVFGCILQSKGQSINTEFGKNRIQYHDDFKNWWQYESENFVTYWYGKAKLVAIPTLQIAEKYHDDIQKVMEHRINDKIEILVYVDISDLKQSNIGTEEVFINRTGETKIVGNKMFVYFDGNHQNLQAKIKEGIARVYFDNMIFGSNLQEILQNALLMNIPEWYKEGIISYGAAEWNLNAENELRELWHLNPKNQQYKFFSANNPRIAGHSFWFFIAQNYGKASIPNLLYLTKISRNIENSFAYILNKDINELFEEWQIYYKNYFEAEKGKYQFDTHNQKLKVGSKKHVPISHLKLSPKGDKLLYVHNQLGKYRIMLKDVNTGKEKRIFKYGYKNLFQETDFNYPLLTWHPTKPEVSCVYEHRDVIKLVKLNVETGVRAEQIIPTDFQRIYNISYINEWEYVFSASIDGWSDLFLYNSKNRNYQRITNDYFDDLDAEYVNYNGENGILFTSNRLIDTIMTLKYDTILPLENFDIYFLAMGANKAIKLASSSHSNERHPHLTSEGEIVCLSDRSGIINSLVINPRNGEENFISNHARNIQHHDLSLNGNTYCYTLYKNGEHHVFCTPWTDKVINPDYSPLRLSKTTIPLPIILDRKPPINKTIIPEEYKFQSKFDDPSNIEDIKVAQLSPKSAEFSLVLGSSSYNKRQVEKFNNSRAISANKKFSLSNVTTKLDNDLLFEGLETYTGDRQQLLTTPLGFLFKGQVKDLFEDLSLEAGMRIPTTFNGSEFFVVFDDKRKLIDKRYALYRRSNTYFNETRNFNIAPLRSRKTALLGMYQMRYPFDVYRSIRATTTFRNDRVFEKSSEEVSFNSELANEQRLSLRLEYVFDNTFDAAINIKHGSRYKIYSEVINRFQVQFIDGFSMDLSQGYTGILGFDARHYIPLLKKSVLALRGAGATSFGSEKMLYYVGGVENGLFPSFNDNIPVPSDANFAYKVNAFHLRGFNNNIRNGSTFLVGNTELRIPFMQYLLRNGRGSSFFRNLQLVGFYDLGLAWHGISPFGSENPLNSTTISSSSIIELEIEYTRDPLVMGYGLGVRTQIFGYFVKLDYGWGIETRIVQKPRLYLSIGLDF